MNKRQREKLKKAKTPTAAQTDAELGARLSPPQRAIGESKNLISGYDFQGNMSQGMDSKTGHGIQESAGQPSGDVDEGVTEESAVYYEHGISGLTRFGGFVYEEWMKELQGRRGALTYREMRDNDAVIGAFMYAIEMLIRQVKWRVEPAGDTPADVEAAEFLESCMDDMSINWNDTISEILTMLPYGWCMMETVYKKRLGPKDTSGIGKSKFSDGRIGWKKWGIRNQETLWRWRFEMDGSIVGMEQIAPPDYKMRFIPIEKALLFRTKSNKNNPEGRSILRNVYRSWYFKKNIEEIEAIGIERDLAGLPVMWLPPEVMEGGGAGASAEQAAAYSAYKKIVTNIKRDEQEGVMLPLVYDDKGNKLYDLELLTSGASRRQFDTNLIIQRYEQRIAMTVMADFLMLGHEKTGSYALSVNKTSLFQTALETTLDSICDVINTYAIPRLFGLNTFDNLTDYPKLVHDDIEKANLGELGTFIKDVASAGGITLGDLETENFLREAANLPKKAEDMVAPAVGVEDGLGMSNLDDELMGDVEGLNDKVDINEITKAHRTKVNKSDEIDVDRAIFLAAVKELADAVRKGDKGGSK